VTILPTHESYDDTAAQVATARERARTWAIAAAATAAAINAETDRLTDERWAAAEAVQTDGNNVAAVSLMAEASEGMKEEADGAILSAPVEGDHEVTRRKRVAQAIPRQYLVPLVVVLLVYLAPLLHSGSTSDMMPKGAKIKEQPSTSRSRRRNHHVSVSDEAPMPQQSGSGSAHHKKEERKMSKQKSRKWWQVARCSIS